jgi:hypothetical protein
MGKATSNRTAIRYVSESVFGTTPTTPALKECRYTGESLNYTIQNTTSKEIRSDRATADLIQTQAECSGDINIEMSYGSFDDLIASALCSVWGAPAAGIETIKNGTTLSSFTFQKHFADADTATYQNFTGCRVGSWDVSMTTGSVVTGKFGLMGLGSTIGTSQIAGATFPTASTTNVVSAVSGVIEIKENGVTSTLSYNKIDLKLNNNLRAQRAIGTLPNVGIALGKLDLTGSVEVYFNDKSLVDRYLAGTSFALSWKLQGSDQSTLKFTLPNCKFESGTVVSGGEDQDIMFSGGFRALYDSGSSCMIQLDRDPLTPGV